MDSLDKLTTRFDKYSQIIKDYTVSQDTQLILYGLYKQAKFGDNNNPQPGFFNYKEKAKWDSWNRMKGIDAQSCMKKYISIVKLQK